MLYFSIIDVCGINVSSSPFVQRRNNNVMNNDVWKVYIFNVSQANSQLIITPSGETVLIDVGQDRESEKYMQSNKIYSWLHKNNIHINNLIYTHLHSDHMCYSENVALEADNVYIRDLIKYPYYENQSCILNMLNKYDIKYKNTEDFKLNNFTKLYYPIILPIEDENKASESFLISAFGWKYLISGDLTDDEERELNIKDVDIYHVDHHGSSTSSDSNFIKNINPTFSIISCGYYNMYNHPTQQTLTRLKDSTVILTNECNSYVKDYQYFDMIEINFYRNNYNIIGHKEM